MDLQTTDLQERDGAWKHALLYSIAEPLISSATEFSAIHISIVGSALSNGLEYVDDLDVYVVLESIEAGNYSRLMKAANNMSSILKTRTNTEWIVEDRRGPLKINRLSSNSKQIHLIVDDLSTLKGLTSITAMDWGANGKLLYGAELLDILPISDQKKIILDCMSELEEMREMINGQKIIYKQWNIQDKLSLEKLNIPVQNTWQHLTLLKYCTKTAFTIFCIATEGIISRIAIDDIGQRVDRFMDEWITDYADNEVFSLDADSEAIDILSQEIEILSELT